MTRSMALPTGPAVVFLFTDIEGSTRSERSVGSAAWASIVARHDSLLREAIEGCGGAVVKTEGDAFFAAFDDPVAALRAATQAQRAVAGEAWPDGLTIRVRMGLHLGEGRLRSARPGEPEDYVGIDVNYAARIAAAGNGRQIVVSAALAATIPDDLATVPGLGPVELIDAGARTVKDFDEPAHLFRLVVPGAADDDRAFRTTDAPTNLPGEVTELVGREADIAVLREALAESRIVTLTGPGGSGKTRLAIGLARDIRDRFPHGTWFIDLAAVREASLIESAIASAIDVRESPEIGLADALRAFLRDRSALLVLDNLEQLLPDGAETVARLVRAAPNVRLVITSRKLLRIAGERGYPVPPLDVDAGVRLFVDRARSHRSDLVLGDDAFVAVRAIAERLGGLPLAIELAAARVRVMSPAMILERLGRSLDLGGGTRDMPERQRTLRGAIAWSHDLLSPTEQRLFARLGAFAGGCTTEAAYAVADAEGDLGLDVAVGLESLADKSLVRIELPGDPPTASTAALDETRFSFHPLLREYAMERLDGLGERAAVEARFAAVCAAIAESAGPAILGEAGEATIHRLDREDHNMRLAIDWSIANDQPDIGLRILGSIWRWFQQRGRLREGRALLATLLGHAPRGDTRVRVTALSAAGGLAYWMNDFAGAGNVYRERLALATTTDDPILMADAHYDIGFLGVANKDAAMLREHEQIALDLYAAAGLEDGVARARQALVLALFLTGDYERALELELQNYEAFERGNSHLQVADSMTLLGAIAFRLNDPATAWQRTVAALKFFVSVDSASGLARGLGMAAILLLAHGDAELGARATGATYRLVREKGVMLAPVAVLHLPDPAILSVEKLGAERSEELMAAGAAVEVEEMLAEIFATPFVPAVSARD
ncbi:MAG: adenylate/guanylate cyclase domain-containing protein [Chloroflexota bacterium]|nr:MAG: adenylate/guanylate cyclase domain-containing protein [Chloroflexota bacterium]